MRKGIMLKVGAFGTIFGVRRRHQGRHRCGPNSKPETRLGASNVMPGEPQTATVDHVSQGAAPQDAYVVFPNVPALPTSLGSSQRLCSGRSLTLSTSRAARSWSWGARCDSCCPQHGGGLVRQGAVRRSCR